MEQTAKSIAIYSRKSRFTGKGESIANQIELCRNHIRSMYGCTAAENVTVFEDEGFSGGNLNRPAFRRMMNGAKRGEFSAIVVYRLDRISRNISDFTTLVDELTKRGISFLSIREQFDTSTPMGRAMMFIISIFSQLERETIAERIRDNMLELAKTGRWLGGNTPTGFASESVTTLNLDGKQRKFCRLRIIPEEASIIREIYDIYTRNPSLTATEAELLQRNVKSKQGNAFSRFTIREILKNPVYLQADAVAYRYFLAACGRVYAPESAFDGTRGIMAYNRTDQKNVGSAAYLPMSEWIVAVGDHPGLIPSDQWIQVQQSLERNASKSYRKPKINPALLTGQLFCSCGSRMYPKMSRNNRKFDGIRYFYVCKSKQNSHGVTCSCANVDGNLLDRVVMKQIGKMEEDVQHFRDCLKKTEMRRSIPEPTESRIAENKRKIQSLVDTLSEHPETAARGEILEKIEHILRENAEIESNSGGLEDNSLAGNVQEKLAKWRIFPEVLTIMETEEKRESIRRLVSRVIWDGEQAQMLCHGCDDASV